jgi:hypothetical protein
LTVPTDTTEPEAPAQERTTSWRDVIKVHPAAELFPMMSRDELRALGEDLRANDMHSPIQLWEHDGEWFLVDGRNRLDAMELLRLKIFNDPGIAPRWSRVWHRGVNYDVLPDRIDPYAHVISANIHRRHLTTAQKTALIESVLKAQPERSNRAIAGIVKVDDKTVGAARKRLEATAEIPQSTKRIGGDGRARPASSTPVPKPPISPEEQRAVVQAMRTEPVPAGKTEIAMRTGPAADRPLRYNPVPVPVEPERVKELIASQTGAATGADDDAQQRVRDPVMQKVRNDNLKLCRFLLTKITAPEDVEMLKSHIAENINWLLRDTFAQALAERDRLSEAPADGVAH